MQQRIIVIFSLLIVMIGLQGCIVGDTVALPFRVGGAVLNVVTPDIVGDSVTAVGESVDLAIPF